MKPTNVFPSIDDAFDRRHGVRSAGVQVIGRKAQVVLLALGYRDRDLLDFEENILVRSVNLARALGNAACSRAVRRLESVRRAFVYPSALRGWLWSVDLLEHEARDVVE